VVDPGFAKQKARAGPAVGCARHAICVSPRV